jgi:hypothetical protein
MLMSPRFEIPKQTDQATKISHRKRVTFWRACRVTSLALLLVAGAASEAQESNPKRAIEKLEGCSKQERKQACINILDKRPAGNGKQAIKAQVRGGRIIWYEYDSKTGKARRTN